MCLVHLYWHRPCKSFCTTHHQAPQLSMKTFFARTALNASHYATGGRLFVLGIFLGFITTAVTCCYTINYYVTLFYSFSSDKSIFPSQFQTDEKNYVERTWVLILYTSLAVTLFAIYVCV